LLALLLLLAACASREYAWDDPKTRTQNRRDARSQAQREEDQLWAQRDQDVARARLITLLTDRAVSGSAPYELLARLSRLYYLEGQVLVDRDAKKAAFREGLRYGDLALHSFPAFRERFAATDAVEEAVLVLGPEAIDGIYWNAVNLAKWARLEGLVKIIFFKDKARAMIERVRALDPGYYHGAADRYLGAYYAALPVIAGRDLKRSLEHFERSLARAPDYLATRTTMATYYAVNADDARLYRSILEEVLAAPSDTLPEVAPEQRLAQLEARHRLDNIEDLFDLEDLEADADNGGVSDGGQKSDEDQERSGGNTGERN
jgi:hypothetical protein